MPKPPTPSPVAADRSFRLGLAVQRLRARMKAESPSSGGWSISQLGTLKQVLEHGPLTASELARTQHVRPQSIAETVAALRGAGLVTAAAAPDDGRKVLLSGTPAGRLAVEEVTSARGAWLERAVATVVGPDELDDLGRCIDLLDRLAAAETDPSDAGPW